MAQYSKFIIAVLWAVVSVVLTMTGVDMSAWLTDGINLLVAFGVLAVPNTNAIRA